MLAPFLLEEQSYRGRGRPTEIALLAVGADPACYAVVHVEPSNNTAVLESGLKKVERGASRFFPTWGV